MGGEQTGQADPLTELLRARTRTALRVILACVGLFALADLGIDRAALIPVYGVKGTQVVFLLAMLWMSRVPGTPRRAHAVAFATVNVTYALFLVGDMMKGHHETTPQLAVVCAMSAASVLPWGVRPQLASALLIEVGSLWALAQTGRSLESLVDPLASVTAALAVSVYVAHEFACFRRDRFRSEAALAERARELEDVNRLKSEFVSTMSHELRTPLNVITGYLDMLEDPAWRDPGLALGRIRQANGELLELIEATLDLSRLESGRDTPVFADLDLADLWREMESEVAPLARRGDTRIVWQPVDGTVLCTDRRKLKIVLKNLVGNAIKFTPGGEVVVGCRMEGAICAVTVRDTGIGIPAEQLPHIFDMFRQVDSTDRRAHGGVGLGLHIVQRLCGQLGGTVGVASTLGRGSTFTVELPTTRADETVAMPSRG